jgi:hypothetical protein
MAMLSSGSHQYVVFKHEQRDQSAGNPAPRERIFFIRITCKCSNKSLPHRSS